MIRADIVKSVKRVTVRLQTLLGLTAQGKVSIKTLQSTVDRLASKVPLVEKGEASSFFEQKGPTLLLGGTQPGWPTDYLGNLAVRLSTQILVDRLPIDPTWDQLQGLVINLMNEKLLDTIKAGVGTLLGGSSYFVLLVLYQHHCQQIPSSHSTITKATCGQESQCSVA